MSNTPVPGLSAPQGGGGGAGEGGKAGDVTARRLAERRRRQEVAVARQLGLVALTDFLCWFPVCILGELVLGSTTLLY